jgi:hypothetical protein
MVRRRQLATHTPVKWPNQPRLLSAANMAIPAAAPKVYANAAHKSDRGSEVFRQSFSMMCDPIAMQIRNANSGATFPQFTHDPLAAIESTIATNPVMLPRERFTRSCSTVRIEFEVSVELCDSASRLALMANVSFVEIGKESKAKSKNQLFDIGSVSPIRKFDDSL